MGVSGQDTSAGPQCELRTVLNLISHLTTALPAHPQARASATRETNIGGAGGANGLTDYPAGKFEKSLRNLIVAAGARQVFIVNYARPRRIHLAIPLWSRAYLSSSGTSTGNKSQSTALEG